MYLCYNYFHSSRNVEIYFYERGIIVNNNEEFASFATRRISTLTKISGYLKGIFIHKISQYYKLYVYLTYLYILAEISACHLQLKCVGGHFFPGPSLHREYYRTVYCTCTCMYSIELVYSVSMF